MWISPRAWSNRSIGKRHVSAYLASRVNVGATRDDPAICASALSAAAGVPAPFEVRHAVPVGDCDGAAGLVHEALGMYRTTDDSEFYQLGVELAVELVDDALRPREEPAANTPAVEAAPTPVSISGRCTTCGSTVSFVRARPDAKKHCAHGHVVALEDLLRPDRPAPVDWSSMRCRIERGTVLAEDRRPCGICGEPLVAHVAEGSAAFRCSSAICFSRFPGAADLYS